MDPAELDRWHGHTLDEWRQRWSVPSIRIFARVGSTNDVARRTAESGTAEGAVVLADEQTDGRGRRGRTWLAPAGASLSMSMVMRPPTAAASRILTLRLGLAAARAIERTLPIRVRLKWPNDLVAQGRKLGGILCEAVLTDDRVDFVIAGIGLNLRRPPHGWPPDVAARAISLDEVAASADPAAGTTEAPALAGRLIEEWLQVAAHPAERLSAEERERFDERDALHGLEVTVDGRDPAVADGITARGTLVLRREDQRWEVGAGTVRTTESLQGERA